MGLMECFRNKLIAKFLEEGFDIIEKKDFMTKALSVCFENKHLKPIWGKFLNYVDGVFIDARIEIARARKWQT